MFVKKKTDHFHSIIAMCHIVPWPKDGFWWVRSSIPWASSPY